MATAVENIATPGGFGATQRRDAWWIGPLATAIGLGGFSIFATFRVFYNADYVIDTPDSAHIFSPFYSPLIILPWLPAWFSPAILILPFPLGFRLTCYYYRKAYYRSFFADPPACAVGEPNPIALRGTKYKGETRLFILQNVHRYFLYLAIIIWGVLAYDAILAMIWPTLDAQGIPIGGHTFGISVATIVLGVNAVLIALYTFSCHSWRHLIGGNLDCFSCTKFGEVRHKAWTSVSMLNRHHMLWAWLSLFSVGFADFYVWIIAAGWIQDIRII